MNETNQYPFPLSTFQQYAIEGILQGQHVLITAPTGSGKTLPADFAIKHFTSLGKKVVYTTPIKALSNQKFYEFSQKYPDISFGILTGDIKINPQAQVLIMTAEILLNTLYSHGSTITTTQKHFQMDIANELACVIMDEVHYINDKERGHVWEETIMLLPPNIQMIMLSATLASPEKFAHWCETRHQDNRHQDNRHQDNRHQEKDNNDAPRKRVYLASETHRSVPLTHYTFITFTNAIFKKIKDKAIQEEIHATINRPFVIQSAKGEFNESHYFKMKKMLDYQVQAPVKRQHVLNQVSKYMVEHDMLPALCFVLSRKSLEKCAHEVTTVLLEDDSKVPYIVRHECEQILRKLPNYQEYLQLPEYHSMVQLLEKGIAIHHAGVMPILREMVELLYAKGYIKLLFATETFAIGLNMPTKTVVFTDCNKYDGTSSRTFYSHEYTQMAGRAGRRGIDTVGNVIHLNNIFKQNHDLCSYKTMLRGIPQTLVSKFKISYHLVLMNQTPDFIKNSMAERIEANRELLQMTNYKNELEREIRSYETTTSLLKTPETAIRQYINYTKTVASCVNKKRKEYERSIRALEEEHKTIKSDKQIIEKYDIVIQTHGATISQIEYRERSGSNEHDRILQILIHQKFIEDGALTMKGKIAANLKEIPCISFTQVIDKLRTFSAIELIQIFSCFTNIVVSDEYKSIVPLIHSSILDEISRYIEEFQDMQDSSSSSMHYDLLPYMEQWIQCENVEECKHVLQTMQQEKDICVGDFVKAILKINNISAEFETVAEMLGDYQFLSLLKEIPSMTLKYIATNQSLYV